MYGDKVLSVILGGGQGSRLYPLTESRSKPAVPIAGKYRLVDIPISNCINSNLKRMFLLTQFNSASLNAHIKKTYQFSFFSSAFVEILAAEQTPMSDAWFQGTADAIRKSMHHFLQHDWDYVLILSGDQLYQMDFNEMLDEHVNSGAEITIATLPVTAKEATGFGIMKTDASNQITSFIEKPAAELLPDWTSDVGEAMQAQGRDYLASMGIYIFNRDLLISLMDDPSTIDFGKEIIPQNIHKHKTQSYQFEGYWTDIGNIDSFFEANIGLTDDLPQFNLYSNDHPIYTRARILPTAKIANTATDKVVIADGSIILADRVERSVIGIRSRIGKGSVVTNTYMMGSDKYQGLDENGTANGVPMGIGENCTINNAILDKNCCIGNNVTIDGSKYDEVVETDAYVIKDGIVVVKKGAVIPDGTTI